MSKTEPNPNIVNFFELKTTGTRTVEVDVRGKAVQVTETLEENSVVEKELGRARMEAQRGSRLAQTVLALPEGSEERAAREAELETAATSMQAIDAAVTFDRRRIVCRRIANRFVAWNLVGPSGPVSLDFDALYDGGPDGPVPTPILEAIFDAVQAEPIVPEAKG